MNQPIVARMINPEPELKTFKCPHCKTPIAETNGTSLRFGDVAAFPFTITFTCLRCGGMVKWRPVNGNGQNGNC